MQGSPPDTRSRIRCIVAGRVQGVFYRAATAQVAKDLAVQGWARNLPDGRVEVVAAGAMPALSELAAWLWDGPPAARVDSVSVEEWTDDVPAGFEVR